MMTVKVRSNLRGELTLRGFSRCAPSNGALMIDLDSYRDYPCPYERCENLDGMIVEPYCDRHGRYIVVAVCPVCNTEVEC